MAEEEAWDQPERILPEDRMAAEALIVDVDGFEGPLDLLLMLSRSQKVDLRKVSVLQLAEQYLGFVERARALRIELAADYLVMAAWLAFLKSPRIWQRIWRFSWSGWRPCARRRRSLWRVTSWGATSLPAACPRM